MLVIPTWCVGLLFWLTILLERVFDQSQQRMYSERQRDMFPLEHISQGTNRAAYITSEARSRTDGYFDSDA